MIVHNNKVTFGLWSAVTVTVLNLLFIIGLTIAPPTAWNGTSAYASSYTTTKLAPVIPSFLLIPAIVVLVVSVYCYASESNKIFGLMGIVFTTIYAVMGLELLHSDDNCPAEHFKWRDQQPCIVHLR